MGKGKGKGKGHGLSDKEIASLEADSVRIDKGVQQVKFGIKEIKGGLFGSKNKKK